jgi:hypothetical protein
MLEYHRTLEKGIDMAATEDGEPSIVNIEPRE